MSRLSEVIDERIRNGEIYYQKQIKDKFSGDWRRIKELSAWITWAISLGILLLLWLVFEIIYKFPIDFSKIFQGEFYMGILDRMIPCRTRTEIIPLVIVFVSLYYFAVTMIYNIFDLLALAYWKNKPAVKRSRFRGEAIHYLYRIPLYIPKWILILWVGVLFGMFGLDNPMTKSGRDEFKKIPYSPSNDYREGSTNNTNANPGGNSAISNRPINAVDRFTSDYIDAAQYSYNNGGPIRIEQTYGLNADEITMAIANAEAYLDSLGYKRK